MSNQVEEIKQKIDIVEYIGRHVDLKKAGRNFKGLCPFHQEKSPSFVVSPDRQIWHCFGTCGVGGDAISFLMRWENLTFFEALKELADQVGIKLADVSYDDQAWKQKERLFTINNLALKFYQYLLHNVRFEKKALEYLRERGLNDKIINTFELGYAPDSWDSLLKYLLSKHYSQDDIIATGLAIRSSGGKVYDRFRNRLMFPLKDTRGNVVGFSGRLLDKDTKEAKYVNTPETDVYHKREHLYGIHLTKDAIRKENNVYVVEGEFDLITPYQHGIDNIVAIKGAALTEEQLGILKRYTKRVTLALDADEAGVEAMKRGIKVAEQMDFELHIVTFSSGKDPDEAIRADKVQFKQDLKKASPIYDFLIRQIQKKYPEQTPFQKKQIGEELVPFIRDIQNPIVQSHYVKLIAGLLDVDEVSIYQLMRRKSYKRISKKSEARDTSLRYSRPELMQRFLLSFLLQNTQGDQAVKTVFTVMAPSDFSIPSYAQIAKRLKEYLETSSSFDYVDFVAQLPAELQSVADELYLFTSGNEDEPHLKLDKLAYEIRINSIKSEMQKLMQQDGETDEKMLSELAKSLNDMEKIVRTL